MKQHITKEQFRELTPPEQEKLFRFFFGDSYPVKGGFEVIDINPEYLTIGRMIEFLDAGGVVYSIEAHGKYWELFWDSAGGDEKIRGELCDALWEAVKEVLEKEG